LGIAAAQACGITASYGTMAKSLQVGKAANIGVLSARLAALGMTASPEVLDHERGFLKAISPTGDVDIDTSPHRLGIDWHICRHGLNIKRYPVCYCAHRTIEAVRGLSERTQLSPDQVERIEATLSKIHATILVNHLPQSALAAKFSVEFAIASALLAGDVSLQQLNDGFVRRSDVQDLMRKVTVVTNEDYDPGEPAFSMHDQVRVFLKNGEVRESEKVRYARGNAKLPLAPGDLERKFLDCVAAGNPELDGMALLGMLQQLETLPSCRVLTR
jgi:2-methylcitrate dehydratase PrpD